MIKLCFLNVLYIYSAIFTFRAVAVTDESDVEALQHLYHIMHSPRQLRNWKSDGGDPCGESWTGVQCYGSSITHLRLHGLGLSGSLQLHYLQNLKQLDISSNNLEGSVPSEISYNVTHINLARNNITGNIPSFFQYLKNLRYLNLSRNSLSGPLVDMFSDLENLEELDLSFNYFTADLPTSFTSLKSITRLFLQNNEFTGPVSVLTNLPLMELNIEHNNFSGVIPKEFQAIGNLRTGGNQFTKGTNYTSFTFIPQHNISNSAPNSSNTERSYIVVTVLVVSGIVLFTLCTILVISLSRRRSSWRRLQSKTSEDSVRSLPVSSFQG